MKSRSHRADEAALADGFLSKHYSRLMLHLLADLCSVIEQEFDAPRKVIEEEMIALTSDLQERNLIVKVAT